MSTMYLQLVNGAIVESGASLTQLTAGDFATTTNSMAVKFKRWVQKAWLDIQAERRNWHFMRKDGLYILKPRMAFYDGSSSISTAFNDATISDTNSNWTATVNGDIVVQTGTLVAGNAVGYFAYKNEDNEYLIDSRVKPSDKVELEVYEITFDDYLTGPAADAPVAFPGPFLPGARLCTAQGDSQTSVSASFGTVVATSENAGEYTIQFSVLPGIDIQDIIDLLDASAGNIVRVEPDSDNTGYVEDFLSSDLDITASMRIRGYARYSFTEQSDDADSLLTDLREVDIRTLNIAPYVGETGIDYSDYLDFRRLPYVNYEHWTWGRGEVNRGIGQPTCFTVYADGTYDFNTILDKEYVLTFRYWKTPQTLTLYNDTVEGIADEYTEIIVFKALQYWAAFDNSAAQRSRINERYMQLYYLLLRDYVDEVKMHQGAGSGSAVR